MDALWQDLRFALRTLSRRPGFALAATLTLALGIGANTAVFGLVHAVLLSPPQGVADPERLVALFTSDYSGPPYGTSSYPDWRDLRDDPAFAGIAAWTGATFGVGAAADVEPVDGMVVTANYFDVLGVRTVAGRPFQADAEDTAGDVVIISHELWHTRLGGDPHAVGSILRVNGRALEIVAVAPAGFVGFTRTAPARLWVPVATALRLGVLSDIGNRTNRDFAMVGRLAPGVTIEAAQGAMALASPRLHALHPQAWTDVRGSERRLAVLPESHVRVPPTSRGAVVGVAGVLGGAAALVLLLCCANVAGLLLARAAGRGREVGIRLSLGAGRSRLIRQLLTESLLLALLGGAAGLLLALWATELVGGLGDLADALGVPATIRPDARLPGFAALASILTAALFGVVPAFRATRLNLASVLRAEATGGEAKRGVLRSALVAAQIAVSVVLLVGAVLLVRTLRSAYAVDPGFETENVLLVSAGPLPGAPSAGDAGTTALRLRERLASLPGVEAATWGSAVPLAGFGPRRGAQIEGYTPGQGEDMGIRVDHIGPAFFETLRIPILRGRGIAATDRVGAAGAVVVNESFVRRYLQEREPIGTRVTTGDQDFTIVGIARDARTISLTAAPDPMMYLPSLQMPRGTLFHLRTGGDPRRVADAAAAAIDEIAPGWSVSSVRTLDDQRGATLGGQRLAGSVLALFALLALVLAAVGLYGVIAFAVGQRSREIGIRIALGARPAEVVALFLRQGGAIVLAGAVIGLASALAATRALGGLLIGVGANDAVSFATATGVVALIALFAMWWPARRAARLDPIRTLRAD